MSSLSAQNRYHALEFEVDTDALSSSEEVICIELTDDDGDITGYAFIPTGDSDITFDVEIPTDGLLEGSGSSAEGIVAVEGDFEDFNFRSVDWPVDSTPSNWSIEEDKDNHNQIEITITVPSEESEEPEDSNGDSGNGEENTFELALEGNGAITTFDWSSHQRAQEELEEGTRPDGVGRVQDADNPEPLEFMLVQVEMVTPSGDPVDEPVLSGDGQNEFTYSTENPGVLTIDLKARVTPSEMTTQIRDNIHFFVEDIGSSDREWDKSHSNGKPEANGAYLEATVTFTNLPANNSDFGAKRAELFYNNEKLKEADYEVFFPRDENNNPSNNDDEQDDVPNWYFYWSQTSANRARTNMEYSDSKTSQYDFFNNHTIIIGDDARLTQIAAWGTPQGIDTFAWTTAHENKHHEQLSGFWPNGWISSEDNDLDWLPNNEETSYMPGRPYDPENSATYPDTIGYNQDPIPDYEDIAMRSQESPYELDELWENGAADNEDWANPGKNSGNEF
ncbi:MAG: hypothetical protein JJT75_14775 [Opitutales bacterium]|nr:hypothetical protein [Opitutales bacterium]MCH8541773.1 hypothetical protein [Opitutales bacterium]